MLVRRGFVYLNLVWVCVARKDLELLIFLSVCLPAKHWDHRCWGWNPRPHSSQGGALSNELKKKNRKVEPLTLEKS